MAVKTICPNAGQQECIKTLNGPVMVLAGPGTGKTFTIIQRIKFMIESGIAPDSILCLTYSEAAANEMKARLVKEIGTVAASVTIHTYHAFCNEIIRQNPMEFELLDGVGLVDDITKRTLMSEVIDEVKPKFYKTKWGDSKYFIPELLGAVDEIKKNQVTKEDYFNTLQTHPQWGGKMKELEEEYKTREEKGKLVKTFLNSYENHKKKLGKAREAWEIFEKYDIKLKQNNFIDFNDMINLVLETFDTNEDFLKHVSAKYRYFLVDEYQDTNYAQNKIVFKLAQGAGCDNIFVVGDDDQIIYEFQGAKTDTLAKFLSLYPATKVICLNENNRSTQNILDFRSFRYLQLYAVKRILNRGIGMIDNAVCMSNVLDDCIGKTFVLKHTGIDAVICCGLMSYHNVWRNIFGETATSLNYRPAAHSDVSGHDN